MKIPLPYFILGLATVLGVSAQTEPPSPSGGAAGRYQLFAGHVPAPRGTETPYVLRIDSTTGETWALAQAYSPGTHTLCEGWMSVQTLQEAIKKADARQ